MVGDDDHYGLRSMRAPTRQGPNYVRFGLSLQDDFQGNSTYDAAVRFVMSDITRNAGEWVTDLQIGRRRSISTELFLPLAQFSGWFVMPHVSDEAARPRSCCRDRHCSPSTACTPSTTASTSATSSATGARSAPVRSSEQGHYVLAIGDPNDPNLPVQSFTPFNTHDYFVRFTYDRLDDINFPHRGQQATLQWSAYRNVRAGSARPPTR